MIRLLATGLLALATLMTGMTAPAAAAPLNLPTGAPLISYGAGTVGYDLFLDIGGGSPVVEGFAMSTDGTLFIEGMWELGGGAVASFSINEGVLPFNSLLASSTLVDFGFGDGIVTLLFGGVTGTLADQLPLGLVLLTFTDPSFLPAFGQSDMISGSAALSVAAVVPLPLPGLLLVSGLAALVAVRRRHAGR